MRSIQQELQLGSLLSVSIMMLLLWWLSSSMIQHFGEQVVLSRIEHDGENILAQLAPETAKTTTINTGLIYQQPFSGHYYSIKINQEPTFHSRSLWDTQLHSPDTAVGQSKVWQTTGPMGQPLLVWTERFQKQNHTITLSVAEDLSPFYTALRTFHYSFAGLSILILVLLILVQRIMLLRSLAPLKQLKQEIQQLEEGKITALPRPTIIEIQAVVDELNRALDQLADRLTRSRNAVGNLAHALKTPLNLILRLSEHSNELAPNTLSKALKEHTNNIQQLLERELRRARLSGSGIPGRRFDPEEEVPILVKLLQQVYSNKNLTIHYQLPTHNFPQVYDRDDLLELLGNLLDNACKWAKQYIELKINYQDGALYIMVSDDGQGCSSSEIEQLTQRGIRIDEGTPGHGLGLSIVSDIVDAYHGTLIIESGKLLSGLLITIRLPSSKSIKQ